MSSSRVTWDVTRPPTEPYRWKMSDIATKSPTHSDGFSITFWKLFDKIGPILLLVVVLLVVTAIKPSFLTGANLMTIGLQAAVNAILALGMTLVIISGGIDLSVGTSMSLAMVVMAVSTLTFGVPMPVGLLIAVASGMLVGLVNGFLIAYGRIPAFIATL